MSFIKDFKAQASASRLSEELVYAKVLEELDSGVFREGLMAKALADAEGVKEKTRALYIKYRVQSMRDEAELAGAIKEDEQRRNEATEKENRERKEEAIRYGKTKQEEIIRKEKQDALWDKTQRGAFGLLTLLLATVIMFGMVAALGFLFYGDTYAQRLTGLALFGVFSTVLFFTLK